MEEKKEESDKKAEKKRIDNKKENRKNNENINKLENKFNLFIEKIKKMDEKIIIPILGTIGIIILIVVVVTNRNQNNTQNYNDMYGNYYNLAKENNITKYNVKFHINFNENIIFNRYDVILSIDNEDIRLTHGENKDIEKELEEGEYTLTFTNADDSSIKAETTVEIKGNTEIGYEISCQTDQIALTNLYIDNLDAEVATDEIKLESDKTEFIDKNYQEVIQSLKDLGFTNITEQPLYDIVMGFTDEGAVENVMINDLDTYKRGDIVKKDSKVVVSYHLYENDDPSKVKAPYTSTTAKNKNYTEVEKAFKDAGFTNVKTKKDFKISSNEYESNTVSEITIDGSSAYSEEAYEPNAEVIITYCVETASGRSNEELTESYAQIAFENYGESIYKYGFKCKWFVGLINEERRPDGSIFIKVEVTITNIYGTKYDTVAEGIVSGTDDSPKVTQFYVSP